MDAHLLVAAHGAALLAVARAAIRHGIQTGDVLSLNPDTYPIALQQPGATFVTLKIDGVLRGCIGRITPTRAVVEDVAANAFAAALEDPRFGPLTAEELPGLTASIAVLGTPAPMAFASEADLLSQLRPGVDGLILNAGHRRALFLPSVWETLPDPESFLGHLKHKAGLAWSWWSASVEVERFETAATSAEAV